MYLGLGYARVRASYEVALWEIALTPRAPVAIRPYAERLHLAVALG